MYLLELFRHQLHKCISLQRRFAMLKYASDVIVLLIICSVPYLASRLRLHSRGAKRAMYDVAKYTAGIQKERG